MAEKLNKVSGSVMVVGGGVAGIQASLDLADSGFHVYLLEKISCCGRDYASARQDIPHQ